jgi:hypothetical protein
MLLAGAGYLPPVAGAVAQELIDVAAVLNALRVMLPTHELTYDRIDTDQQQGNAHARPERSATSKRNKQPSDDQAGKDAHTGTPADNQH